MKAKSQNHFAVTLRRLREEAKLTQQELSARSGLPRETIARLEIRGQDPTWSTVQMLAKGLAVSVLVFVDPTLLPPPPPPEKRGRGRPRLS